MAQTETEQWDVRFIPTDDPEWDEVRGSHGQLLGRVNRELPMIAIETTHHGEKLTTRITIARLLRHLGLKISSEPL